MGVSKGAGMVGLALSIPQEVTETITKIHRQKTEKCIIERHTQQLLSMDR